MSILEISLSTTPKKIGGGLGKIYIRVFSTKHFATEMTHRVTQRKKNRHIYICRGPHTRTEKGREAFFNTYFQETFGFLANIDYFDVLLTKYNTTHMAESHLWRWGILIR